MDGIFAGDRQGTGQVKAFQEKAKPARHEFHAAPCANTGDQFVLVIQRITGSVVVAQEDICLLYTSDAADE